MSATRTLTCWNALKQRTLYQVRELKVTSTAGVTTSGFTLSPTTTGTARAGTAGTDATSPLLSSDDPDAPAAAAASSGPALEVLVIDTSSLAVVIPTSTSAGAADPLAGPASSSTSSTAAAAAPAIDLKAIVDTVPPIITLKGNAYVSVSQATAYTEPGVGVYDNIDGNTVQARRQLKLCRRPEGAEKLAADDRGALSCDPAVFAAVNTSAPGDGWVWVFNYTARDVAGNNAVPVRRIVEVMSRWDGGQATAGLRQERSRRGGWRGLACEFGGCCLILAGLLLTPRKPRHPSPCLSKPRHPPPSRAGAQLPRIGAQTFRPALSAVSATSC